MVAFQVSSHYNLTSLDLFHLNYQVRALSSRGYLFYTFYEKNMLEVKAETFYHKMHLLYEPEVFFVSNCSFKTLIGET